MTFWGFFKTRAKARVNNQRIMNPYIGLLISATDTTGLAGGTGAWDDYIAAFKSALVTNVPPGQWYEEPSTRGGHGAAGDQGQYDTAAGNLVGYNPSPSVIVTGGTLAAKQCQNYTTTIPIVVASAGEDIKRRFPSTSSCLRTTSRRLCANAALDARAA
jgi:hypothetical protein